MRAAIVEFPGTTGAEDVAGWLEKAAPGFGRVQLRRVWHQERDLGDVDLVVLPGGFSHGAVPRPGAVARHAPVMSAVLDFAAKGGKVLGIADGFHVLTEAGLLPGTLLQNVTGRFVARGVDLLVDGKPTPWTRGWTKGSRLRWPIACSHGNFYLADPELDRLEEKGQIVLRFVENPTGTRHEVAAIVNEAGNVLGMIPHPERAVGPGGGPVADGARRLVESLFAA